MMNVGHGHGGFHQWLLHQNDGNGRPSPSRCPRLTTAALMNWGRAPTIVTTVVPTGGDSGGSEIIPAPPRIASREPPRGNSPPGHPTAIAGGRPVRSAPALKKTADMF